MKEEILTKDEKKEFEKYINFMLQNGFKKEEFEFTKIPNPNPCILKVRVRDFSKNFNIDNGVLEGMVLGQTYMLKDLGLYASKDILSDKEKEYLSAVIKPFKDRVCYIRKDMGDNVHVQYINIKSKRYDYDEDYVDENDVYEYVALPYFKKDTMYVNMEVNKNYTLKDLGL